MEYPALGSLDLTTLRWLRTQVRPLEFTLSAGDAPVAQLRWQGDARSVATAESGAGTWTVTRAGFLNPHLIARSGGSDKPLGRLSVHLDHHSIDIAGGRSYRFKRAGVLVPAWTVDDPQGAELLHIEPVREGHDLMAGAVLAPASAGSLPEFRLLLVLSWSFIAHAWFEDEALVPLEDHEVSP